MSFLKSRDINTICTYNNTTTNLYKLELYKTKKDTDNFINILCILSHFVSRFINKRTLLILTSVLIDFFKETIVRLLSKGMNCLRIIFDSFKYCRNVIVSGSRRIYFELSLRFFIKKYLL